MTYLYILFAILIFGVLIAVHEFGHFAAAKLCGVKVLEFSIGMGPAFFKRQKGETLYSLRAIPMGGFCAMEGEDEASEDPRSFTRQSAWKRALILVAGSFMNFLLGFIVVLGLYMPAVAFNAPVLADFMPNCPYESVEGFQKGDRILRIDGKRVRQYSDVSEFISAGDGVYDIVVLRDGEKLTLSDFELVPVEYEGQERKMLGFYFGRDEGTFVNKVKYSWYTTLDFCSMVWDGLRELVSGNVAMQDMAGAVGIVDMMAETGEQSESVGDAIANILFLGALIAVNLAIMNMLPIPALDGGRVFFLLVTWLIEKLIGRRLDPEYEGYVHAAGMVLLLALMVVIMFNDIVRIVTR